MPTILVESLSYNSGKGNIMVTVLLFVIIGSLLLANLAKNKGKNMTRSGRMFYLPTGLSY